MKHLRVSYVKDITSETTLEEISIKLNSKQRHFINISPWVAYSYIPNVSFAIVHTNTAIYLKYFVDENYVQARYHQINDPVYNDSCVEFFIGFAELPEYYNLEFNCLGTALIGYGKDRQRKLLDSDIIKTVSSYSTLQPQFKEGPAAWELTVRIPVSIFNLDDRFLLQGKIARANFFKCGDDLPTPHYCVWNSIDSPQPDFHLPQYFGLIEFL